MSIRNLVPVLLSVTQKRRLFCELPVGLVPLVAGLTMLTISLVVRFEGGGRTALFGRTTETPVTVAVYSSVQLCARTASLFVSCLTTASITAATSASIWLRRHGLDLQ